MASEVEKILAIFEEVILGHKLRPDQRDALLHKISPLLTTYIDSVVEQKVLEGRIDELEKWVGFLETMHESIPPENHANIIKTWLEAESESLTTLRHRYEQMKGEVK